MNQLGWRNKVRDMRKQRDAALAKVDELEARGVDTAELDLLKAEVENLKLVANEYEAFKVEAAMPNDAAELEKVKGELRASKMREGRLKKQVEKLKK